MTEVVEETASAGENKQVVFDSQNDVDAMIEARLDRERKKFADYDDLKAKAEQFDRLQADGLSETDKLKAQLEAIQAERETFKAEALRSKIALEVGVPADLQNFLTGSDEEEVRAAAKTLVEHLGNGSKGPRVSGIADTPKNKSVDEDSSAFAGSLFRRSE